MEQDYPTTTVINSGVSNFSSPSAIAPNEINISMLSHGYIVRVGCQTFAFTEIDEMLINIETFLESPQEVTDRWMKEKQLPV